MGTAIQKQYLELEGKPVLYYCLHVFQESRYIDEIVLVTGEREIDYCREKIVQQYGFDKVVQIVAGGKERYESVYHGLKYVEDGIVFIHDGARPFVDEEMVERAYECVLRDQACVVGMPVKDTIKIADQNQYAVQTPDRAYVWQVQTPQVFDAKLVRAAYEKLIQSGWEKATDDAMVVERMTEHPVKLVFGSCTQDITRPPCPTVCTFVGPASIFVQLFSLLYILCFQGTTQFRQFYLPGRRSTQKTAARISGTAAKNVRCALTALLL